MRNPPESKSAKNLSDIIIPSIFIKFKYRIQKYRLCNGAHKYVWQE